MNKQKTILFVCTGNTCRSPMAEGIMKARASKFPWEIISAGVSTADGYPASKHAIKAMSEIGIDISGHKSQLLNQGLINRADLIVTMSESHRSAIVNYSPQSSAKVCLLKSFETGKVPADIADPFGGSLSVYRNTRDEIERAISDLILFLLDGNQGE